MCADQKYFRALDNNICLFQLGASRPDRFYFPSFEDESSFESFFDEIIVKSLFVLDDAHCRCGALILRHSIGECAISGGIVKQASRAWVATVASIEQCVGLRILIETVSLLERRDGKHRFSVFGAPIGNISGPSGET